MSTRAIFDKTDAGMLARYVFAPNAKPEARAKIEKAWRATHGRRSPAAVTPDPPTPTIEKTTDARGEKWRALDEIADAVRKMVEADQHDGSGAPYVNRPCLWDGWRIEATSGRVALAVAVPGDDRKLLWGGAKRIGEWPRELWRDYAKIRGALKDVHPDRRGVRLHFEAARATFTVIHGEYGEDQTRAWGPFEFAVDAYEDLGTVPGGAWAYDARVMDRYLWPCRGRAWTVYLKPRDKGADLILRAEPEAGQGEGALGTGPIAVVIAGMTV